MPLAVELAAPPLLLWLPHSLTIMSAAANDGQKGAQVHGASHIKLNLLVTTGAITVQQNTYRVPQRLLRQSGGSVAGGDIKVN